MGRGVSGDLAGERVGHSDAEAAGGADEVA